MAEPTLEVLLPGRGALPWIAASLRSLAGQTRPPERVTLIDDGLEGQRAEVEALGARLLGTGFRVIENRGRGISAALNTGVAASGADWIARMDADDVAHPRRFADQLEFLQANPALLACGCQVRQIDADGRLLGESRYPVDAQVLERSLLQRSCFAHPSLLIRREVLHRVPYRPLLDGAEDVDLMLRLAEHGPLANLAAVRLDYRVGVHQMNYRRRARQTALQELAFRAARIRRAGGRDPLDEVPALAAAFVDWRLGQAGYADSRQAMTAARYLLTALQAGQWRPAMAVLGDLAGARPWRPTVLRWVYRVLRDGPGGLARQPIDDTALGALNP